MKKKQRVIETMKRRKEGKESNSVEFKEKVNATNIIDEIDNVMRFVKRKKQNS